MLQPVSPKPIVNVMQNLTRADVMVPRRLWRCFKNSCRPQSWTIANAGFFAPLTGFPAFFVLNQVTRSLSDTAVLTSCAGICCGACLCCALRHQDAGIAQPSYAILYPVLLRWQTVGGAYSAQFHAYNKVNPKYTHESFVRVTCLLFRWV